jgi:transposase
MNACSEDLRLRIIAAVDGGMSRSAAARVFGVGRATVKRYLQFRQQTGALATRPRHGPPPTTTAALRAMLLARLEAAPDATLAEQCAWYEQTAGVRISGPMMGRVVTRHVGWTRTNRTLSASEQDEAARAAWRANRVDRPDPVRVRRRDWRPPRPGPTIRAGAPRNRGRTRTAVTSLTLAGMGPGLLVEGGSRKAGFEASVEHILAPTLRGGQIVAMDNLTQHLGDRTRALIEARGAELWLLPGYSPELDPIEEACARLKTRRRTVAARTHEALAEASWAALRAITPDDARGYFIHAGYPPLAQLA